MLVHARECRRCCAAQTRPDVLLYLPHQAGAAQLGLAAAAMCFFGAQVDEGVCWELVSAWTTRIHLVVQRTTAFGRVMHAPQATPAQIFSTAFLGAQDLLEQRWPPRTDAGASVTSAARSRRGEAVLPEQQHQHAQRRSRVL